jgi:hypothetical protein
VNGCSDTISPSLCDNVLKSILINSNNRRERLIAIQIDGSTLEVDPLAESESFSQQKACDPHNGGVSSIVCKFGFGLWLNNELENDGKKNDFFYLAGGDNSVFCCTMTFCDEKMPVGSIMLELSEVN